MWTLRESRTFMLPIETGYNCACGFHAPLFVRVKSGIDHRPFKSWIMYAVHSHQTDFHNAQHIAVFREYVNDYSNRNVEALTHRYLPLVHLSTQSIRRPARRRRCVGSLAFRCALPLDTEPTENVLS